VRARERDHVGHGEVVLSEDPAEEVEVEARRREVAGHTELGGDAAVTAAELYAEPWASGLRVNQRKGSEFGNISSC